MFIDIFGEGLPKPDYDFRAWVVTRNSVLDSSRRGRTASRRPPSGGRAVRAPSHLCSLGTRRAEPTHDLGQRRPVILKGLGKCCVHKTKSLDKSTHNLLLISSQASASRSCVPVPGDDVQYESGASGCYDVHVDHSSLSADWHNCELFRQLGSEFRTTRPSGSAPSEPKPAPVKLRKVTNKHKQFLLAMVKLLLMQT